MDEKSEAVKVALQESEDVQGAIARSIGGMYTLFGIVVPAVFGLLLFSAGASDTAFLPTEFLSVGLAGVFSLAILFSSALWMEAIQGFRYKYLVLMPRLYELTGRGNEENFLQYQARTRTNTSWLPNLLFQFLAFGLVGFVSICGVLVGTATSGRSPGLLLAVVVVSLLVAAIGGLTTQVIGRRVTEELRRQSPRADELAEEASA